MAAAKADAKIGDIQFSAAWPCASSSSCTSTSAALIDWFPHPIYNPDWLTVDLLFVISVHVIASSLRRDCFEPFAFPVKRVFRLMPGVLMPAAMALALNHVPRHVNQCVTGVFR